MMKNSIFIAAALLVGGYMGFRIFNLDELNRCRKIQNFFLCAEVVLTRDQSEVSGLLSDEKMIATFKTHKPAFDAMLRYALSQPPRQVLGSNLFEQEEWRKVIGIFFIERVLANPIRTEPGNRNIPIFDWSKIQFRVNYIKVIDRDYWPYDGITKNYTYSQREHEVASVNSLNGIENVIDHQPSSMELNKLQSQRLGNNCLKRRIQANWYIETCAGNQ